jgi:hypothetical protein
LSNPLGHILLHTLSLFGPDNVEKYGFTVHLFPDTLSNPVYCTSSPNRMWDKVFISYINLDGHSSLVYGEIGMCYAL